MSTRRLSEYIVTHLLVPALLLAGILLADLYLVPQTTITPACCVICMTVLALYMRPLALGCWGGICLAAIIVMLCKDHSRDLQNLDYNTFKWVMGTKALSFAVVVGNLVLLSWHRQALRLGYQEKILMLSKIAAPVIIFDSLGIITYMNDQASKLLKISPTNGIGRSYFEFFRRPKGKGFKFGKYASLFQLSRPKTEEIEISTDHQYPPQSYKAITLTSDSVTGRQIVTIITGT